MTEKIYLDKSDRSNLYREGADNVFAGEMSVEEARDWLSTGIIPDEETSGLIDEAQGLVHMNKARRAYLVIKITE